MIGTPVYLVMDYCGLPEQELKDYIEAQNIQLGRDYYPSWGRSGTVSLGTPGAKPEPGKIQINLLQKPTLDGAGGYHDCQPDGTPVIYVFVGLAKELGVPWQPIASHEVLETQGDPLLRRAVETDSGFIDSEVCDRVEAESYNIGVSGGRQVPMSNFNLPECFEPPKDLTGVKFDFMGTSKAPDEVRPGGYAQRFDPRQGWVQRGEMSAYRLALSDLGLGRASRRSFRYEASFLSRLLSRIIPGLKIA